MRFADILKMCFDSLSRRKGRTILTVLGVFIGCTSIIVMVSIGAGMQESYDQMLKNMGDLSIIEVYRGYNQSTGTQTESKLDDKAVESFHEIAGVKAVMPKASLDGYNVSFKAGVNGRYTANWVDFAGIDSSALEDMGFELMDGRYPEIKKFYTVCKENKIMIFGAVLAGGIGSRMGNVEKPKQYLNIAGKPIIIHTLEKFYVNDKFEKIIVLCPNQWVNHTENLIKKYIGENDKIVVISGGSTRNETIMNAIAYIEDHYTIDDDSVIVTHDSVRPFVTHRIIEENIKYAQEYGACDTVVPATDTIVKSMDNEIISEIPDRSKMYQGQTPQSFKIKKLKSLYEGLSEEEKTILTDAAKIFVIKGEKVHLVEGEVSNTKITYPYDLRVAETLISEK